jgi:mannose-6-phosphate isomerase-like protein (cupin superfamily)
VPIKVLKDFEDGSFAVNLGRLREILKKGYHTSLTKLLSQYYNTNRQVFDADNSRPFERDSHYSVCLESSEERAATPFFMCGDSKSYVWAVPMRTLKKQPILTDLLELAPSRSKFGQGATPTFSNDGVEVIYVIHGRVEIHIQGLEDKYSRKLRPGEFIHFRSSRPHRVANVGNNLPALVMIVRLPNNSESGKSP